MCNCGWLPRRGAAPSALELDASRRHRGVQRLEVFGRETLGHVVSCRSSCFSPVRSLLASAAERRTPARSNASPAVAAHRAGPAGVEPHERRVAARAPSAAAPPLRRLKPMLSRVSVALPRSASTTAAAPAGPGRIEEIEHDERAAAARRPADAAAVAPAVLPQVERAQRRVRGDSVAWPPCCRRRWHSR